MYYIITPEPGAPVLKWLNRQSLGRRKHASLKPQSFKQVDANQANGIAVNSWEGVEAVLRYYHGVLLYQGKRPGFSKLIGMCCKIVNRETGQEIYLVCVPSPAQLMLKQYKVLHSRCLSKLLPTAHKHFLLSAEANIRYFVDGKGWEYLSKAGDIIFLSIDSETKQEANITTPEGKEYVIHGVIDLVSATAVTYDKTVKGGWVLTTIVFPMKTWEDHKCLQDLCRSPYPKSFQNGLYDLEYFTIWQAPVKNYAWDTEYYTRSITSDFEGAYNLAAQAGMWCHEAYFWKELTSFKGEAKRDEKQQGEYINYAGLDSHWTAMITLNQMISYNKLNIFNFILRNKYTPLCMWFNLQGFLLNDATHRRLAIKYGNKKEEGTKLFKYITGGLGVNQSAEILPRLKAMGEIAKSQGIKDIGKINKTDIKAIDGLRVSHPMFEWFIDLMSSTRTADKWLATFINFKQYKAANGKNYFKYCLNPFVTASMRLACKASNLWCGGNSQNVNLNLREMWVAPEGYALCSIDAPSAEAYTTGYLADEENLISVLIDPDIDFHRTNGSAIFEIPYEDIDPPKRKLAKPVGFGFFYGMLAGGLLMTMGIENVRALRDALGLFNTSLIRVCGKTVSKITKLYPKIRGKWYYEQLSKVVRLGRLPFQNGFAPVICGNVLRDKKELNSVMSLEPQGTSADINLGGCNNVMLGYLKDNVDDLGIIPIAQIHDELICLVPLDVDLNKADKYLMDCFRNATRVKSGKVMRIPPGIPVYAMNGKSLKADELPRGDWTKGLKVEDALVENYHKVIPEHGIDFDVKDVEYLLTK